MPLRAAFLEEVHPQIRTLVERCIPDSWRIAFARTRSETDRREAAKDAEIVFIIGTGISHSLTAGWPNRSRKCR